MSNIKYRNITGVACKWLFCALTSLPLGGLGWALTSCSDYDDYNTVPVVDQPNANLTLWENISRDTQLTKFTALARQSKYDAVLNSMRFFTVWAPVDAAFSDADYNRLMASDSATIVKQFFHQHITEYNYPVSAALDSMTIVSLNAKHHPFTQSGFDAIPYSDVNLASVNGVMHKLNGMSEFYPNLYENIDNLQGCDSLKNYIQKNDYEEIDKAASVLGPIRNGVQTYQVTVMKKRNNVIRDILRADLEAEDSTFCMLLPNDHAWSAAYDAVYPHYNYIAKLDYMDLEKKTTVATSIKATDAKADKAATPVQSADYMQDSLTCRNIVSNLVFSNSYQRNQPLFGRGSFSTLDSAYSTNHRFLQYMPDVMAHTTATGEMSNGITRTVDSLAFRSWQTYDPVITATYPDATLKVKKLTSHNIPLVNLAQRDSLFSEVPAMFRQWLFPQDSQFFSYVAVDSADVDGSTSKPEFNYALHGVRSSTYHIYVVTVPAQVEEPEALVRPYYLRFYLSWTDASNKQQLTVLPQGAKTTSEITTDEGESTATVTYLGNPGKVNVIDLGEFTFPACYYGLDAYPSLMMAHTKAYTSSANRRKYDQQMRVAGVYLVPKEYNDVWDNEKSGK